MLWDRRKRLQRKSDICIIASQECLGMAAFLRLLNSTFTFSWLFLPLSASFFATYVRKKSRRQCVLKERGLMWSPTPGYFNYLAPVFDSHLFFPIHSLFIQMPDYLFISVGLCEYLSNATTFCCSNWASFYCGEVFPFMYYAFVYVYANVCVYVFISVCAFLSPLLSPCPLLFPSPALCAHVYVRLNTFMHMKT